MLRVALLTVAAALLTAAPAAAQPPPGANDFTCRSAAHPVPVILVHGTFGDMTVTWNLLSPGLKQEGYCVFALDLPRRAMGSIDRSADALDAFVDDVRTRTGAPTVSLVGHDQGGVLGRYLAKSRGKATVIDDIVGLAPLSHGSPIPLAPGVPGLGCRACWQLRPGSAFLERLDAPPQAPPPPSYTVISTREDDVPSQALEGATNVVLQDRCPEDVVDHVGIVYDPIALQWTLNALGRPGPADPAFRPLCSDRLTPGPPFAFVTAGQRYDPGSRSVALRLRCDGAYGRCPGRLVLRDARRRLASVPVDMAADETRRFAVRLARAPRKRLRATVTTLQPGGYVKVTSQLRRRQHR